ncbi:Bug family tripartite tricarboxylate transporter substrate binding protein [Halobacterium yunchengense]|uniref:Bug family tripartite tricarboxylate transporter substrate binding protein n=1 Tax=Halobacterium yunchengense TaxID=3108497 RepID=UPI0030099BF5
MPHNGAVNRRQFVKGAGTIGGAVALAGCTDVLSGGGGGNFPNQDITMICPWAEGGGTDRTARELANLVSDEFDEADAFVENRTGGTGSVGFNAVANAEPDGYTVGVLTVEITTISHLGIADVSHEDVQGIMQYNFDPAALTVREDAPYDTLQEFVDYADENPGEISVSNSGPGGIWHLSAVGFGLEADIELDHVGYDGGAPATQAVVNEEVEATTSSAPEVLPQVEDGPLKTLAVFGEERLDIMPDVPTLQEENVDFTMGAWRGLGVPNDTDEDRIETLHEAYNNVYESDEFQSFMDENGFGLIYRDTSEFNDFMQDSYDSFEEIAAEVDV